MSETIELDIEEVIRKHKLWQLCEEEGCRADLRGASLEGINLEGADLEGADLEGADLEGANLMDANLLGADLRDANLRGTDLRDANLRFVNLMGADLEGADLKGADLKGADLKDANLMGVDLKSVNLRNANLLYAKGFYLLPVQDPRGYSFPYAVLTNQGWRVRAGCRTLSLAEAREHWGDSYVGERWIGDMYLHACNWLESMINENSVKALAGDGSEG